MRRYPRRRMLICCRHPWPLRSRGFGVSGLVSFRTTHGTRTGVLFCKPSSHPLRMLKEFVRAVHHALLLRRDRQFNCAMRDARAVRGSGGERNHQLTSLEERAFDVKSLQQEVKHRSTRLEYMRRKSCICGRKTAHASAIRALPTTRATDLLLFNDLGHVGLLGRVHL